VSHFPKTGAYLNGLETSSQRLFQKLELFLLDFLAFVFGAACGGGVVEAAALTVVAAVVLVDLVLDEPALVAVPLVVVGLAVVVAVLPLLVELLLDELAAAAVPVALVVVGLVAVEVDPFVDDEAVDGATTCAADVAAGDDDETAAVVEVVPFSKSTKSSMGVD
jgi:hypothetical protein